VPEALNTGAHGVTARPNKVTSDSGDSGDAHPITLEALQSSSVSSFIFTVSGMHWQCHLADQTAPVVWG
jgi:hypothetical protein